MPISFLPGQAGGLFHEFGFVLAIAVLLSSVVALTLCPMLASRFLKEASATVESEGHGPLFPRRIGGGLANFYRKTLHACLSAPFIVVLVAVLFAGASYVGYGLIRQELTPSEDRRGGASAHQRAAGHQCRIPSVPARQDRGSDPAPCAIAVKSPPPTRLPVQVARPIMVLWC
ncbi:efflux RND transporter permease subunit [Brucella abortus]|nr:efflux RND transporter permease subunit [Brucella abortus]